MMIENQWTTVRKTTVWLVAVTLLFFIGCATKRDIKRKPLPPPLEENLSSREVKPDHLALARQLIEKGYHDVALVQIAEAEKKNGPNPESRFLTGVCEREEGRLIEAEAAFQEAIRQDANYAPAYNGLGITLFASGKPDEGLKAFEQAVSLNPGEAAFQNNLGYGYLLESRLPEAEKHFRKSTALMPGYPSALNNLGFCLIRLGRDAEALQALQRMLSPGEAYNNLGAAHERCGRPWKALVYYREALRKSPNLAQARKNVSRLEQELEP